MTMKIGTQAKERTISSEGVRDEAEVQLETTQNLRKI